MGVHKNYENTGGKHQICTPVASSLLISAGHSPPLGGTIFVWGGTSSHLGGHSPGMPPPVAPGLYRGSLFFVKSVGNGTDVKSD